MCPDLSSLTPSRLDMDTRKSFIVIWRLGGLTTMVIMATLTGLTLKNGGWFGYLRLVQGGATAQGVVVRTDPGNHCLAKYTFTLGTQSYSGSGPNCSVKSGQNVEITYLVSNPDFSCLGSASARLENELATFVLVGIIFPPLFAYGIRRRKNIKPQA